MGAENNARTYANEWNDLTGAAVGAGISTTEMKDYSADGYSISNESITVPASADADGFYRVMLTQQPRQGSLTVTRTSGSVTLTQVAISATPGANEVGVDWQKGVLNFPASAAGAAHTATFTGNGSVLLGPRVNQLQKDLNVVNLALLGVPSITNLLTRNPRVLYVSTGGDDTSGNGSIGYPYATIEKAFDVITAGSSATAWEIVVGPGSHTWTIETSDVSAVAEDGEFPEVITYYQIGGSRKVSMRGEPGSTVTISVGSGFTDVNLYLALYSIRALNFVAVTGTPRLIIGNRTNTELVQIGDCSFSVSNVAGNGTFQIYSTHTNSFVRNCRFTRTGSNAVGLSATVASISNCSAVLDGTVTLAATGMVSGCIVTATGSGYIAARSIVGNSITSTGTWSLTASGYSDGNVSNNTVTGSGLVQASGNTITGNTLTGTGASISSASNIVGNYIYESGSGSQSTVGLITANGSSKTLIVGNTIISDEEFAEIADGGRVMIVNRITATGDLEMRANTVIAKCIVLFNSHPSTDSTRNSADKNVKLIGNFFQTTRTATVGTTDVHCVALNYARGEWFSQGNTFRAVLAASTKTDAHHACVFFHPQTTSGTQTVRSINDRFELTIPAGTITVSGTSTNEKSCVAFFDGSEDRLDAIIAGPSISVDGNQTNVFAGLGSPKVVVAGVIDCNAAVTYQNAPAGAKQVVRGELKLPDLSTGTDAHFVTIDSGGVALKEPVGLSQATDIYDSVGVGTHNLTFTNGLLTGYTFTP